MWFPAYYWFLQGYWNDGKENINYDKDGILIKSDEKGT